jgi:hypothetical protein
MGMYTEFIFGCELSKKTPKVCVDALDYVINGEEKQPKYENPDGWEQKRFNEDYIERTTPIEEIEKFIEEYDFYRLFCSCSYYFGAANPVRRFEYDHISDSYKISTRADLKNYTGQIENFIEYIAPYVISGSGYEHSIFAYVQYEEDHFPTMYGFKDYNTHELKVFKNPVFNDEDPTLKYKERIAKLYDSLSKLFQGVCPDWSVTEDEYKKRGLDVEQYGPKMTLDETWDWMIDYLVEKYGKNEQENGEK